MKTHTTGLLTLLLAFGSIPIANASTIYTNQAAFEAATGTNTAVFTASGFAVPIPGGFALNLFNLYLVNNSASFTPAQPLYAFGALWDNAPEGPGTGMRVFADNTLVGEFGVGTLFQGFWGFTSTTAFTSVRVETSPLGMGLVQEHLTVKALESGGKPLSPSPVPEPGTLFLMGAGLLVFGLKRK